MNISKIQKAAPNQRLWDRGSQNSVRGLNLRVSSKGKKVFYLYYRDSSKIQRCPKLGDVGVITLEEARNLARKILHDKVMGLSTVNKKGVPVTLKELFLITFKEHWSKEQFKKSGHTKVVQSVWGSVIAPTFGPMLITDIDTLKIRQWHNSLSHTPVNANRAKEVLSKIFNYAEEIGLLPVGSNPCRGIKHHPEISRNRYASPEELKRIVYILEREFNNKPNGVTFLFLLLYTGARPSFIERAVWTDITTFIKDGQTYGVLKSHGKSSAKTGEDEIVVIPPQVMDMLNQLPRIQNGTLTNCKLPVKLWAKIRLEADCPDLWARDLRRTFATIGLSHGIGIDKIGEVLNHKNTQTTKIYSKLMNKERIETVTQIANKIDSILKE